jgi:hypothetical protein
LFYTCTSFELPVGCKNNFKYAKVFNSCRIKIKIIKKLKLGQKQWKEKERNLTGRVHMACTARSSLHMAFNCNRGIQEM